MCCLRRHPDESCRREPCTLLQSTSSGRGASERASPMHQDSWEDIDGQVHRKRSQVCSRKKNWLLRMSRSRPHVPTHRGVWPPCAQTLHSKLLIF